MGQHKLDLEKYSSIARQAVAESCVLLKNDDNTLPLRKGIILFPEIMGL